jgi:DNA-binding protein H-NS
MSNKLESQLAKLTEQIEAEHAKFKGAVTDAIVSVLTQYGLTIDDLLSQPKPKRKYTKKAAPKAATKTKGAKRAPAFKGPQPPKYREPKSGVTWSGFGRAPAWITEAKDRDKFLINGAAS